MLFTFLTGPFSHSRRDFYFDLSSIQHLSLNPADRFQCLFLSIYFSCFVNDTPASNKQNQWQLLLIALAIICSSVGF